MASNFDFLGEQFPELFTHATHTESMGIASPRASCFYARFTLEQAVLWLYNNDAYLKLPYDDNLGALIHEQTFKDNLKPGLFPKIRTIHKVGNLAAHSSSQITTKDSLRIVEDLFHFLYWLCRYYSIPPLIRGARGDRNLTFNPKLLNLFPTPKYKRICPGNSWQS